MVAMAQGKDIGPLAVGRLSSNALRSLLTEIVCCAKFQESHNELCYGISKRTSYTIRAHYFPSKTLHCYIIDATVQCNEAVLGVAPAER